ncbi:hypothetical protein AGMMS49950_05900 [Endomicrobiia bacterium]|nr:hypothetical protein AGMMS49950_05900 [Endomicrobiia bacterium]
MKWLKKPNGRKWLKEPCGGRMWLKMTEGHNWLKEPDGGQVWLREKDGGWEWLKEPDGRKWLKEPDGGRVWLRDPDGYRDSWLREKDGGWEWLKEPDGGRVWLRDPNGGWEWLKMFDAVEWLDADDGKEWLRTDDGKAWFRTTGGNIRKKYLSDHRSKTTYTNNYIHEDEILENKQVMEILKKAGKTALRELTCEDVRKAYRSLAMKYHPDKCLEKSDEEKERIVEDFKELGSAYDMLNKYLENMGIVG